MSKGPTTYSSGHQLSLVAVALLAFSIAVSVLAVVIDLVQLELLGRIASNGFYTMQEAERSDSMMALTGMVQSGLYIITAVFFLVWLHRVSTNLRAFRIEGLKFSPGWTVGWWFIPVFNLVRPYQAVSEIWRASQPPVGAEGTVFSWRLARRTLLLPFWWGLWITSSIIGSIAGQLMYLAEEPEKIIDATSLMLFSDALDIVPAILLILLVRSVDRRQDDTSGRLGLRDAATQPFQLNETGA